MKIFCNNCKQTIAEIKIGFFGIVKENGKRVKKFVEDPNGSDVIYEKENGILSVRRRLDGHLGFECVCGNDSRIAEVEKNIVNRVVMTSRGHKVPVKPTDEEIAEIQRKVEATPTKIKSISKDIKEIDNFKMEFASKENYITIGAK